MPRIRLVLSHVSARVVRALEERWYAIQDKDSRKINIRGSRVIIIFV